MMLKKIQNSKNVKWISDQLKSISPGYKTSLKEGRIQILHGNIVLYKPILANHRYVALIIIPQSLRGLSLAISTPLPVEGIWGNIKPSTLCGYDYSGI